MNNLGLCEGNLIIDVIFIYLCVKKTFDFDHSRPQQTVPAGGWKQEVDTLTQIIYIEQKQQK